MRILGIGGQLYGCTLPRSAVLKNEIAVLVLLATTREGEQE